MSPKCGNNFEPCSTEILQVLIALFHLLNGLVLLKSLYNHFMIKIVQSVHEFCVHRCDAMYEQLLDGTPKRISTGVKVERKWNQYRTINRQSSEPNTILFGSSKKCGHCKQCNEHGISGFTNRNSFVLLVIQLYHDIPPDKSWKSRNITFVQ